MTLTDCRLVVSIVLVLVSCPLVILLWLFMMYWVRDMWEFFVLFLQVKLLLFFVGNCFCSAVLVFHCSVGFALVGRERGSSLVVVCGLLTVVASLVAVPGL